MRRNKAQWWVCGALLLGAGVASACAGKATSAPVASPTHPSAPRASGAASQTLTVRPVDIETLETIEFPCPQVDEKDPDYIPCDGGAR
jgi:hypothetical protein